MSGGRNTRRLCEHPGCSRVHFTRGFCDLHHQRWKFGIPMDGPPPIESLEGERWRPIGGYEGIYEGSDFGRGRRDPSSPYHPGKQIHGAVMKSGYRHVVLSRDKRQKSYRLCRIVAAAFFGPAQEGYQVNHKDGQKDNDSLSNLEYVTPAENARHAVATGLTRPAFGIRNGASKLNESKVRAIRRRWSSGSHNYSDLASTYGVTEGCIGHVIRGSTWSHVK